MTPLDVALGWIDRGFHPIPIPYREKAPKLDGWQKLRIDAETAPKYFNGTRQNIGILLGEFGAADVDLDCQEALSLARALLPETRLVFGRAGKPASHWFYRVEPPVPTRKYIDLDGKTLLELRCRKNDRELGLQTVVPPSVHPSGEAIRFEPGMDGHPANVDAADLQRAVSRIAAGALLARHWPAAGQGRHVTELALAGVLARAGWPLDEALQFVVATYQAVPTHDRTKYDRVRGSVEDTYRKHAEGQEITGVPTLIEKCGKDVVRRALEWLGIDGAKQAEAGPRRESYLWNDAGNADRLVDLHGSDLRYCPERCAFMTWAGTHWAPDSNQILVERLAEATIREAFSEAGRISDETQRKAFLRFLNTSLQRAGITNMVHSARRKVKLAPITEFDADPYLLNFRNGTLNLRTGELQAHRREDQITKCIPYAFDPAAACPTFQRSLHRILGGSHDAERTARLAVYLKRAIGSAAIGKATKTLYVLWGDGDNGKTTLVETIRYALGGEEYSGEIKIETLMASDRDAAASNAISADLAALRGCRFVSSSEVREGQRLNQARVKYLTGMGQIRARYLRENYFNFQPSHTLFLDCNRKPIITDPGDAVWNRLKLFPFTVQIPKPEQDARLGEKLRAEAPGIMNWIAEGAREYLVEGLPDIPEVSVATDSYRHESDRLQEFLEESCVLNPEAWVQKKVILAAYTKWAEENGERFPLGKRAFEDRLKQMGLKDARDPSGTQRVWRGVGLAV